jgi:hypothetical protein
MIILTNAFVLPTAVLEIPKAFQILSLDYRMQSGSLLAKVAGPVPTDFIVLYN